MARASISTETQTERKRASSRRIRRDSSCCRPPSYPLRQLSRDNLLKRDCSSEASAPSRRRSNSLEFLMEDLCLEKRAPLLNGRPFTALDDKDLQMNRSGSHDDMCALAGCTCRGRTSSRSSRISKNGARAVTSILNEVTGVLDEGAEPASFQYHRQQGGNRWSSKPATKNSRWGDKWTSNSTSW